MICGRILARLNGVDYACKEEAGNGHICNTVVYDKPPMAYFEDGRLYERHIADQRVLTAREQGRLEGYKEAVIAFFSKWGRV